MKLLSLFVGIAIVGVSHAASMDNPQKSQFKNQPGQLAREMHEQGDGAQSYPPERDVARKALQEAAKKKPWDFMGFGSYGQGVQPVRIFDRSQKESLWRDRVYNRLAQENSGE